MIFDLPKFENFKSKINELAPNYISDHVESVVRIAELYGFKSPHYVEFRKDDNGFGDDVIIHCDNIIWMLKVTALLHDIIEDTEVTFETLYTLFKQLQIDGRVTSWILHSVQGLTKPKGMSYHKYMQEIVGNFGDVSLSVEAYLVYNVKKADYKDHFMRVETLSDKLIKKYTPWVQYFL